ncbi:MAG TPA: DUF2799 domain-containing protein [Cellvibrio sp.]|nr:DUF2799 domain-containing protein [Cellvibrio sp.]
MSINYLLALLAIAMLAGCATMSKDECLRADWYLKGLDDASQGYALDRLDNHSRACARVQVVPNTKDYEAGHKKGARLYCVVNKGYSEGRRGASYNGICPRELEDSFLRAYRDGQALFSIQQKIDFLASEVSNNEAFIDANYDQIHRLKHELVDRDSSAQERRYTLRRIDDLQYEIVELELRIDRALRERELLKYDFRTLEDKHYRQGYTP